MCIYPTIEWMEELGFGQDGSAGGKLANGTIEFDGEYKYKY